ncbi:MAG: hypothetical protein M1826_004061 [Phylliscum demangeonii]|nr:MAG: hypothetical protein M1826_004061 [Phylliscum demangeonii]
MRLPLSSTVLGLLLPGRVLLSTAVAQPVDAVNDVNVRDDVQCQSSLNIVIERSTYHLEEDYNAPVNGKWSSRWVLSSFDSASDVVCRIVHKCRDDKYVKCLLERTRQLWFPPQQKWFPWGTTQQSRLYMLEKYLRYSTESPPPKQLSYALRRQKTSHFS